MQKKVDMIILSVIVVIAVCWSIQSVTAIMAMTYSIEDEKSLPTIVIDAGHGGFDGGAVGVGGLVEKKINLEIAQKLYDLFTINGFEAVLTRNSDISLESDGCSTIRKKKNSDIHNRMAVANNYDECILLSIHQNKFTNSSPFGAQIFYGSKNEQSKQLGETLQKNIINMVQPENTRQAKACTDSVYLIYNAKMPALLVECGFLSNPEDALMLVDENYQKKLAFTIFSSITESLGLHYQDPAEAETPQYSEREK